jgi:2-oxoisovalerate dehydrogenase E1 component subunit alpha
MTQVQSPMKAMVHVDIERETLLKMYYMMLLSRAIDERFWLLHRQGKIHFHISAMGHEAAQAAIAANLVPGKDFAAPYYRDLTTSLMLGLSPRAVFLAWYGRAGDLLSGARQMPGHYNARALNIVTVSSPVATQLPHAVGIALAAKLRGEDAVVYTACGEGSAQKGDFHEACNFAGIHKLPVIFVIQNNGYAISEPTNEEFAVQSLAVRAEGYGFPGVSVDGMDVFATYRAAQEAVARARRGEGATLIEARCYRLMPHSSDDDDRRYRSAAEVAEWKKRDPISQTQRRLLELGVIDESLDQELRARAQRETDEADAFAEQAPLPRGEEAIEHVYGEGSQHAN